MLNISHKEQNGVSVLSIYGRVDHASSPEFEKSLFQLINKGLSKLVIDFSNFNYISSSGLRVLLLASKTLKTNNGMLVLASIPPHIYEVLEISGLHSIFDLADTVQDGIQCINKDSKNTANTSLTTPRDQFKIG